jgi:hypothetical protein
MYGAQDYPRTNPRPPRTLAVAIYNVQSRPGICGAFSAVPSCHPPVSRTYQKLHRQTALCSAVTGIQFSMALDNMTTTAAGFVDPTPHAVQLPAHNVVHARAGYMKDGYGGVHGRHVVTSGIESFGFSITPTVAKIKDAEITVGVTDASTRATAAPLKPRPSLTVADDRRLVPHATQPSGAAANPSDFTSARLGCTPHATDTSSAEARVVISASNCRASCQWTLRGASPSSPS